MRTERTSSIEARLTCRESTPLIKLATAAIGRWVSADLSAFYIETLKDRLYADAVDSESRRSAQTVLLHVYNHLLGMLAPITPLLVEEAWEHTPGDIKDAAQHPLQRLYPSVPDEWRAPALAADLPWLLEANNAIKAAQERARSAKTLGSSLQCAVVLSLPSGQAFDLFERYTNELDGLFVVSAVSLSVATDGDAHGVGGYSAEFPTLDGGKGTAHVLPPRAEKCPRCWKYTAAQADELCARCHSVVEASGEAPG